MNPVLIYSTSISTIKPFNLYKLYYTQQYGSNFKMFILVIIKEIYL